MKILKTATCVLVPLRDEQFLGVSRRNSVLQWGFPGGKVDPGESLAEAAAREFFEEVGVAIQPQTLVPLFSGLCPGKSHDDSYWVSTYLYAGDGDAVHDVGAKPEEGLTIKKLRAEQLTSEEFSPFAAYNAFVFAAFDHYRGACAQSFDVEGLHRLSVKK